MLYFDYSATTPVNIEVLESFKEACLKYPGNPNSLHTLGIKASSLIEEATCQIAEILNVKKEEIIYTSGSSESNNLALKGIAFKYQSRGKHILTTPLEHSSIYGPLNYLTDLGFEVDFVSLKENGEVDLENLKSLLREDTILVSIHSVNSELGIIQPIEEIGKILKQYPKCFFHVDMTQSIGKIPISLENVDLASFSAHKFYGLKGIGCLVKKEKIQLTPLIHGGKSTTAYRSGTPALPLIVSMAKALRLSMEDLSSKQEQVRFSHHLLKEGLKKYKEVSFNSPETALPNILNISIAGVKPETMLHALEEHEVYISTQSACSSHSSRSKAVYEITKDEKRAASSIRISLSYLTTKEEIEKFLVAFEKCLLALSWEVKK